ncbi:hypothetical protein Tco_1265689 [Tanacetum coccineum]
MEHLIILTDDGLDGSSRFNCQNLQFHPGSQTSPPTEAYAMNNRYSFNRANWCNDSLSKSFLPFELSLKPQDGFVANDSIFLCTLFSRAFKFNDILAK